MNQVRTQVLIAVFMLGIWGAILAYVLVNRPEFRQPFAGPPQVSLFWFLMVLLFAWNALRLLRAWQKSFDRPKPPVRRTMDHDEKDLNP